MISPRVFYNNNFKCISYLNREKASSADPALALLSLPLTPCVISQSQRIRHWCSAFALFVCVHVCVCRIISWQANALNWNKMAAVARPLCLPKCVRAFCSFWINQSCWKNQREFVDEIRNWAIYVVRLETITHLTRPAAHLQSYFPPSVMYSALVWFE